MISIFPLQIKKQVVPGDDLAQILIEKLDDYFPLKETDCIVISSQTISLSQERIKPKSENFKKDLIQNESSRVLRETDESTISETKHGFVCTDAGIEEVSGNEEIYVLLPKDCDQSAHTIRNIIKARTGYDVSIIVTQAHTRPFRKGKVHMALGISGLRAISPQVHKKAFGSTIFSDSKFAIADEIACAAGLVMQDQNTVIAALIREIPASYRGNEKGKDIVRNLQDELFR